MQETQIDQLPVAIFGENKLENVVNIDLISPTKAIVYQRLFHSDNKLENSYIKRNEFNWNYWFLIHDKQLASSLARWTMNINNEYVNIFKVEELRDSSEKGDMHFRYYVKVINEDIKSFYKWDQDTQKSINILDEQLLKCYNYTYGTKYESIWEVIRNEEDSHEILRYNNTEQFLIQTGITHYKNMTLDNIKIMSLDIETTGLNNERDSIFLVATYTNYTEKPVLFHDELDDEAKILRKLEHYIQDEDPDIIVLHNGFGFDLPFIRKVAERNNMTLSWGRKKNIDDKNYPNMFFLRNSTILKVGESMESFMPAYINGRTIIDTLHLAKRYNSIKRDTDNFKLKYLAHHHGLYKDNPDAAKERTYIEGENIYNTWLSDREEVLKYAGDDVWETLGLFKALIGSTFAQAQMVPATPQKLSHCGSATVWTLFLVREYLRLKEDNTINKKCRHAIPLPLPQKEFVGGYVGCEVEGMIENAHKLDFSSLYPSVMLVYKIKPKYDFLDVFISILKYVTYFRLDAKKQLETLDKKSAEYKKIDSLQSAMKIIINSSFGMLGSGTSNFNNPDGAEQITTTGQRLIKGVRQQLKEDGCLVVECDSVTNDTPIFIRDKNTKLIDIISISTFFDYGIKVDNKDKRRFNGYENYEVLTRNGWKNINYVKKHKTNKTIYRLCSYDGYVKVTEDHSIFRDNKEILPKNINIGDISFDQLEYKDLTENTIDDITEEQAWLIGFMIAEGSASRVIRKNGTYSINISISNKDTIPLEKCKILLEKYYDIKGKIYDCNKSSNVYKYVGGYNERSYNTIFNLIYDKNTKEKKIPISILNINNIKVIESFIDGLWDGDGCKFPYIDENGYSHARCNYTSKSFVLIAGIQYLLSKLNKDSINRINIRKDKKNIIQLSLHNSRKIDDIIRYKDILDNYNDYVYDISTEDGTFIGGLGYTILHNTDGIVFQPSESILDVDKYVQDISDSLPDGLNIEHEAEWPYFFSYKIKNYIMYDKEGKIKVKGAALKSSNKPAYIRESFDIMLKHLFNKDYKAMHDEYASTVLSIMNKEISLNRIATNTKYSQTIQTYKKGLDDYRKLNNKNKAEQAFMELLIDKYGNTVPYNIGDKIWYYKLGAKGGLILKHQEPIKEVCSLCSGKGCEHCEEGYIYEYITCEKCRGTGTKLVPKTKIIKNIKNTSRSHKLDDMIEISNNYEDLDNIKDLLVSLKLDNFTKITSFDYVIEDNIATLTVSGTVLENCRTCNTTNNKDHAGYIRKKQTIKTLNCRLLEDAPETPDYNIDYYVEQYNKVCAYIFRKCFTHLSKEEIKQGCIDVRDWEKIFNINEYIESNITTVNRPIEEDIIDEEKTTDESNESEESTDDTEE